MAEHADHAGQRLPRRGQPLVFLATVVALWIAARAVHHLPEDKASPGLPPVASGRSDAMTARVGIRPRYGQQQQHESVMALLGLEAQAAARAPARVAPPLHNVASAPRQTMPVDLALAHQRLWIESLVGARGHAAGVPGHALVDRPILADHGGAVTGRLGQSPVVGPSQRRWSVYGWSLVRQGSQPPALAAGGQYGGSQAGLVVRLALDDTAASPAAYVRATSALASADDRSLAFGVSARPWPGVPVDLAVERRLGLGRGQRDQFAAMLVGGIVAGDPHSAVQMEGFGQAGVIGLDDQRGFFDLQMVASRSVAQGDRQALRIGAGLWAGGQQTNAPGGAKRWLHRVDVGPRAAVDFPLGDSRMTLAVDWRHRIDGDARPVSGPAVTLSAGF